LNDSTLIFRTATDKDLPAVARLRSTHEDEVSFWQNRITQYLAGIHNPQKALPDRVVFVAEIDGAIVGFIAGQLTTRYDCDGELQWLDVAANFRRKKLASKLLRVLAQWFIQKEAYQVCVDPGNDEARRFYFANDATNLNSHWMYWDDIRQLQEN
jgi:ribosomal protein S18 acetylase RimI-like enzyme